MDKKESAVTLPEGDVSDVVTPEIVTPNVKREPKPGQRTLGKSKHDGTTKLGNKPMDRFSAAQDGRRDEMRWTQDNKFVYHYDKRTMVLMEEDGYPDPIECFDRRDELFKDVIERENVDEERAKLGLDYCEWLASGGRTRKFLREHEITWSFMNFILRKSNILWLMYRGAMAVGEVLKQQVREDEADRRAIEGVQKPVYQQKELVGYVTEYSDNLLITQLKAGNPEKYADRQKVDHQGVILNVTVPDLHRDSDEG